MNDLDLLSRGEEVYLLSILELKDNAYGVSIKKNVSKKTGKELSYGGLYFSLGQLVKKGYVLKKAGEPTRKRGGRRKYYYTLTEEGKKSLQATYQHQKSLWKGRPAPISD
ncbi:MAG: PadR family transcriptional regulator [Candidatus Aminicenantes bacterium]|nr:PadR family transcriptional regulator [Candidatus Aminicenantes bacterium]